MTGEKGYASASPEAPKSRKLRRFRAPANSRSNVLHHHALRAIERGGILRKLIVALAAAAALAVVSSASAGGWATSVAFTNKVVSSPVSGYGYPVPAGATRPDPGTCGPQQLNSNHSESWLAVKPGTEDLVGSSKFFVGEWSTFYDFHLGSYTISNGSPVASKQVQGYECTTVGT